MNTTTPEKESPTVVIFRKFRPCPAVGEEGGDIIALFPEIPADVHGNMCESYMHVGQHGAASHYALTTSTNGSWSGAPTMAATPEEYADLKDELEGEPYHYNLVVRKKSSHRYDEARRNEARRKRDAD